MSVIEAGEIYTDQAPGVNLFASLRETLRESCAAVSRLVQKQGVTLDCTTEK